MIVHRLDRLTAMIVESSTHDWVVSMAVIASISMNVVSAKRQIMASLHAQCF